MLADGGTEGRTFERWSVAAAVSIPAGLAASVAIVLVNSVVMMLRFGDHGFLYGGIMEYCAWHETGGPWCW